MENVVKELDGIRYRIHKKEMVRDYVLTVAKKEWDPRDFELDGDNLVSSVWVLREVPVAKVKPNENLLASPEFQKDLGHRIQEVRRLLRKGKPIPPLILRGSDLLVFDGYARWRVMLEMRATHCLAYVGETPPRRKNQQGRRQPY